MTYPTPRAILRRVVGPQVAEALLNTGLAPASLARSVLEASGTTPEQLEQQGLNKAEKLAPSLDYQVGRLVYLAQLRAERTVAAVDLSKCDSVQLHGLPQVKMRRLPMTKAAAKPAETPSGHGLRPPACPTPPTKTPMIQGQRPPRAPAPTATATFTKGEAAMPHALCGQTYFEAGQFVGCLCYAELAKSATTSRMPSGYAVRLPLGPRVRDMLRDLGKA